MFEIIMADGTLGKELLYGGKYCKYEQYLRDLCSSSSGLPNDARLGIWILSDAPVTGLMIQTPQNRANSANISLLIDALGNRLFQSPDLPRASACGGSPAKQPDRPWCLPRAELTGGFVPCTII